MSITSKDILEAVINKTISIQEAKFLVENYNDEWMSDDNFPKKDSEIENEDDFNINYIWKSVSYMLMYEEGWRVEDITGVLKQILDASKIKMDLEDGKSVSEIIMDTFNACVHDDPSWG
jgi:hypothetical protein